METEKNGSRAAIGIPLAIVIAGIIIAGAVYFSNKNSSTISKNGAGMQQDTTIAVTDLTIKPISDKDYIRGNPNAKVVIVEFSDTECPFCKKFHSTMKELLDANAKDGTMAWVYRNFPLEQLHSKAPKEAEALLCAGKIGGSNGFWNYTDRIYAVTNSNDTLDPAQLPIIAKDTGLDVTAFNACLSSGEMKSLVQADLDDAITSGGTGTPYNVFVANKAFDQKEVEEFLVKNILQYGFPTDLFAISNDSHRVSVSGSMPAAFMQDLINLLAK